MINYDFHGSLIIRNIVGRCRVTESYQEVIRYAISRLEKKFDAYREMNTKSKASFVSAIIKEHDRNRELYGMVTTGRF